MNAKSITVVLSEQQAKNALTLLDVAVKAAGLQATRAALELHDLIQAAYQKSLQPDLPKTG